MHSPTKKLHSPEVTIELTPQDLSLQGRSWWKLPVVGSGIALGVILSTGQATVITKETSGTDLTIGTSWVGGTGPGIGDVATWGTPSTASLGGALTIGAGGLSWQGIDVQNATANVAITGAGALTLGTSGITIAAAGKDLTLQGTSGNGGIVIGGNQIWNTGSGRILTIGHGANGVNQGLSGSGNISITGAGTVVIKPGDNSVGAVGFSGSGNASYAGNWEIGTGSRVTNYRNGANAWGTGSITLSGGTIAQNQGSWTWTNNVILSASTTSTFEDANTSGTTRFNKLQGVFSGSGNVTFTDPNNRMSLDNGYILTGTNTMSGTVTVGANADVRVGGVAGNDTSTAVGSSGTLGTAAVLLNAATSTLTLSRNDTWTFANDVSGSGVLRIGVVSGSATHIATVSGNNTHSGGTTLQTAVTLKIGSTNALGSGTFTISGNGLFDNATGAALTVANAISLTGGSPTFSGTDDMTFNGAGLIGGANRTITVSAKTLTLGGNIAEDAAGRGLTKAGAGTLVLSGTNGFTGIMTINGGTLVVSGGAAISNGSNVALANTAGVVFKLNSSETIAGLSGGGSTGGSVDINGQTLTVTPPAAHSDFNGALTGSGTVAKAGANQLRLGGTNTFTGTHQIDGGLVIFTSTGSDDGLPNVVINGDANSGIVIGDVFASGELAIGSLSGTGGKVRVDWNAAAGQRTLSVTQSADTTFAGTLEDFTAGRIIGLKKSGSGMLTLTTSQPYTGTTNVVGGTLALSGTGALADSTAVSLSASGAKFDIAGVTGPTTEKIGSLSGVAGSEIALGANTLEFGDATNTAFSGVVGGIGGGLKKMGSGTFTLNGMATSTYTGATSVVEGTLQLGSSDLLPNTATFNLGAGTTLATGGFNDQTGSFTLGGNAVIDLGGGSSTLTFSGIDSWTGELTVLNWNGTPATAGGAGNTRLFFSPGSLTSQQLSNVRFYSGGSGSPEVGSGGMFIGTELVAVPEPSVVMISSVFFGGLLLGRRRQKQSN